MVQINFAQKTVNVKIVYYGPGMSGKTTNLEVVHQRAPDTNRGELTSISTDGDRTLFFDYMPLDLGTVAGMRTCFQVYTVPGQVYYNSTRKLVLQGVDGVIFVADSSASMLDQNLESLRNLEENLNEYGKSLSTMAHVMQWNKRDLPDAMPVEELERHLNHHGEQSFEAVANTGQGVFPTLKALAASVLRSIMQETGGARTGASAAGPAPVPHPRETPLASPSAPMPAGIRHAPPAASTPHTAPLAPAAHAAPPPGLELRETPPLHHAPAGAPARTSAPQVAQAPAPAVPHSAPSEMMQVAPTATAAPHAEPRSRSVPVAPARRPRRTPAPAPVSVPKKRGGAMLTGGFILLAAGAGALLAWVVLTVL